MRRQDEVPVTSSFEWQRPWFSTVGYAVATLIIVAACGCESLATFVVKADGLPADTRIELELCGRTTQMTRQDGAFVASGRVTCEGEATVRLSLADGGKVTCKAGYITPGLNHGTYEVTVVDQQCSVRLVPSG